MYDCDANHYHDYDGHALHDYDGQDCGDQYFDGCDDHDFHDDHDGDFIGNDDDGLADYDALSACDEDYHDTIDSLPVAIFDAADPFIDGDNGPPGDCYEGQDDIQSYVDVDMHMATGIDFYTSTDDDVVISSDRDSMVVPEGNSDEGELYTHRLGFGLCRVRRRLQSKHNSNVCIFAVLVAATLYNARPRCKRGRTHADTPQPLGRLLRSRSILRSPRKHRAFTPDSNTVVEDVIAHYVGGVYA